MKGFAITLDALIAISFVLLAMMIIAGQSYQPLAASSIYLKQLTMDAITVLEKTGAVDQALLGNTSAMQRLVEASPKLACMSISIRDSKGDVVTAVTKSDCTESAGLDMEITTRSALYQGGMYVIRAESWFRKEPD